MLTRIRNAVRNKSPKVDIRCSKVCTGIAKALKDEGYIEGFNVIDDGRQGILRVDLRYGPQGQQLIHSIERASSPGRRVYTRCKDLPRPLSGLGICIVSTPRGVLSDRQARREHVGGELLCTVE
jgi:small subunit ribosomal protein S8